MADEITRQRWDAWEERHQWKDPPRTDAQRERKNAKERQRYLENVIQMREKSRATSQRYYHKDPAAAQERARLWYAAHRERAKATQQRYVQTHAAEVAADLFERHLWRQFRLSLKDFEALVAVQGGVCAICGRSETKLHTRSKQVMRLSVDHDHETGVVRGLLCSSCNIGTGYFGDDPARLRSAADYLETAQRRFEDDP